MTQPPPYNTGPPVVARGGFMGNYTPAVFWMALAALIISVICLVLILAD